MSNPQLENGYTKIAHEILETLAKTPLNGTQRRIIDVVFRYTYGYHKKEHELSESFISNATEIHKQQIKRELKALIDYKILKVTREATFSNSRIMQFNKNYEQWVVAKKIPPNKLDTRELNRSKGGSELDTTPGSELDTRGGSELDTQKIYYLNIIKDNKDILPKHKTPEETYQENIGLLTPHIADRIKHLLDEGLEEELINRCITISVENNARNWAYVEKVAISNLERGIKTLEQFEAFLVEWNNKKNNVKQNLKPQQHETFQTRQYSDEYLESFYTDVTE